MSEESEIKKKGGRSELLLLIAIFAAPVLCSWLIYNYTDIGRGESGSYGRLIVPPIQAQNLLLYSPENQAIAGELHGRWSLIYIMPEPCGQECQQNIHMLQRLKSSLANNSDRLQLIVATKDSTDELHINMSLEFSWGVILMLPNEELMQAISKESELIKPVSGDLLIVDPAGNIMMRYDPGSDGSGILQDIKRLLRYSRIG